MKNTPDSVNSDINNTSVNNDISVNDGNDNINTDSAATELAKAYAADRERKNLREEELQAARDYLGVILEEAADRNTELEGKKQEADILAARLSRTEEEVRELKKSSASSKRQGKFLTFWMFFSLFELIAIGCLIFVIYRYANNEPIVLPTDNSNVEQQTVQNTGDSAVVTTAPETYFYNDELANYTKFISLESIAPFDVSVEDIDGLEYLVFTDGTTRVCYKNEYYAGDMSYRKCVLIEQDEKRYSFVSSYDLNSDIADLCPRYTTLNGVKYLCFLEYQTGKVVGIPSLLRLISIEDFRLYECRNIETKMQKLFTLDVAKELSTLEDAPFVYSLVTSKASYKYAVPEYVYNDLQYNEAEIGELSTNFEIKIEDEKMTWTTYVMLGDSYYLGKLNGELSVKDTGIELTGAKYGAFVPSNQEDPELNGYIRPSSYAFERYLTANGNNGERFYVEVIPDLEPCEYYWDNLNTDDSNNWIYYDADGNKASYLGIDVSKYQAVIDWEKVAASGVEFAIIRLGFRGMNEGTLELDAYFLDNIKNATANGIKVGIYFFSQAINTEEAVEEAQFVINALRDYEVTYPVIIDTERVTTFAARANNLSMAERTDICIAFCEAVKEAGYKPMIYSNVKYMLMGIDLTRLSNYDKWFACYTSSITFPYNFQILQYTDNGSIDGISGKVDLNLSFVDYSAE